MNIETEIPEILFKEMKEYIDSKSDYDQYTFITSALNNFLYKNGCQDRKVAESYLNDVFHQSPSEST